FRTFFGASDTYEALGEFKSGVMVASACFPHQVRLVYHSEYQKGRFTEAMTWLVRDGKAEMAMDAFSPGYAEAKDEPSTLCTEHRGS
ncbi:MAG TPA: hypothetical protein VLL50_14230, partial [Usitatibacter sp.]|nr:hypothetical protein [Usitatibacter sp.]